MSAIQIKQRPTRDAATIQGMSGTLARVLANRGVNSTSQIDYGLKRLLPPQGLMHINDAAELLTEAITADATIVIVIVRITFTSCISTTPCCYYFC